MIKNRSTLKGYFVKGAIPTESNFADLVDSVLNQEDDNIAKLPNDPLRITATGVDEALLNFYRLDQNQPTLTWQIKQKPGGASGLSVSDATASRLFIENATGNLSVGTTAPVARLDVSAEPRSGTHPTAVKGLYVTGGFSAMGDGVEFRHSNGTQGIGFGYNSIYATGSNTDQDLGLKPRGAGKVISYGPLQVSGAQLLLDGGQKIAFSDADVSNNLKVQLWTGYGLGINGGTLFYAANGRHSWRDNAGTNERMALTTGSDGGLTVSGTGNSSIAGKLGLGITAPVAALDIQSTPRTGAHPTAVKGLYVTGDFQSNSDGVEFRHTNGTQGIGFGYCTIYATGSNVNQDLGLQARGTGKVNIGSDLTVSEVYFTNTNHSHVGFANTPGAAAIENAVNWNALMILGRAGTPLGRHVAVWDTLTVNGTFNNNSDRRVKKDIQDLAYGLEEVLKLRPVEFNWINIPNPHKSLGFIAQEVQPVISEVVYENPDSPSEGKLSIAYVSLVPVLVNAIKELAARLSQLENKALADAA